MNSDNESLAFVEEDDVSPAHRNAPPAEVSRPRIMGTPTSSQPKSTAAKPPLHHAVSPSAAAAAKRNGPVRPGFVQMTSKLKPGKQDTASEFSDNESVNFMVESNSMSCTPIRGVVSSANATNTRATGDSPAPKRLSRKASNSSIQFHSEPGSRSTSPQPNPHLKARGSISTEKALTPQLPTPTGKTLVQNDSISFVFEQSDGGDPIGAPSPHPKSPSGSRHAGRSPIALAATVTPAAGGSVISNDSIAFQIDDDSNEGHHQQAAKSPSSTPLARATTTMPSATFSVKSDQLVGPSASVADTSHNELADCSSIAFDMVDDSPAGRVPLAKGATTSTPKQASAVPYYNSHVRRSRSAQSRLNSRPNSPSIQFETEHNSDNESLLDQSASRVGARSPSIVTGGLPIFAQQQQQQHTSIPALLIPEVLKSSPTMSHPETGSNVSASNAPPTKKTIVTNHLQHRRQQHPHQSWVPSPHIRLSTQPAGDNEASLTPSTHPPLYRKAAVSTPIAAQAAGAATEAAADDDTRRNPRRSSSLTDRNHPKKKDANALLNLQHPQKRRSKESATSESQGASPNAKLFTEAGSTATTDSPLEPPHTGRHSRTSTDGRISVHSFAAQSSQRGTSMGGAHSSPNSVQDYLENQEMENVYHHHQLTQHAGHGVRADRVLYREISPPSQYADPGAAIATAQETEQWRRFNEHQRAELAQLRHRIALARRQDCTVLESSPVKGFGAAAGPTSRSGGAPQPTPLPGWPKTGPGYSDMKQKLPAQASPTQEPWKHLSVKSGTRLISPAATEEVRNASPQSRPHSARRQWQQQAPTNTLSMKPQSRLITSSARQPQNSSRSHDSAASLKDPARLYRAAAPPPSAAASSGLSTHALLHSPAAVFVADMLGMLWPPRSAAASSKANRTLPFSTNALPVDLYFVNGSRLTASQVDCFLELVRIQAEAEQTKNSSGGLSLNAADITLSPQSYRHFSPTSSLLRNQDSAHDHPLARRTCESRALSPSSFVTKRQRAPLSAKLAALFPKKAVRRSRVMREVFDVMDLKRQGSLVLDLLPSLGRLFEGELASLEQARMSLLEGKSTPLATLLESAIASRQQYTSAWHSGRSAADYTPSSGLSQVLSADGAGLTPEAQAELIALTHRLLLLSFAVNVVIPIASASRISPLDFSTLCMVLYAAVDNTEHEMDSPREQWREVVQQYFILLDA